MKLLQYISLVAIVCISFISCQRTWKGEGPVADSAREVGDFHRVVLSMQALVIVKDSMAHSCIVKAQQNIQEAIITRMDGNTLVITSKGELETDEPVVIEISLNQAVGFEVNGSGTIRGANTLKNDELDIEVNGSGIFEADIVTTKTVASVSGSGTLNLSGSTNTFDIEINGSGTVNAFNFSCLNSKARISGSGEAFLNVGATLRAEVTGSGSVRYHGDPEVKSEIDGSGTVQKQTP